MSSIALTEAKRLERLTSDLLSYAHPGDCLRGEADVFALVGYIASIANAQALGKRVSICLNIEDDCRLLGSEDELQQALLNLMRNAIDISPDGGVVSVRCDPYEGTGQLVRLASSVCMIGLAALEMTRPASAAYANARVSDVSR